MISIHAPARGATFSCSPFLTIGVFQSTLPHGERPADLISPKAACNISIHAPARGATLDSDCKPDMVVISIHAPARGATFKLILISRGNTFQSTLPHGERRSENTRQLFAQNISIHAPARGATLDVLPVNGIHRFQSTLPHGERPGDT